MDVRNDWKRHIIEKIGLGWGTFGNAHVLQRRGSSYVHNHVSKALCHWQEINFGTRHGETGAIDLEGQETKMGKALIERKKKLDAEFHDMVKRKKNLEAEVRDMKTLDEKIRNAEKKMVDWRGRII